MKNERRSAHRTQWAAQFAVASELCKRDYQVALTLGNRPMVDLMVISPQGQAFVIDVKGLYQRAFWGARKQRPRDDLYYIFAYVPDVGSNRFFILPQTKVNAGIELYRKQAIDRRRTPENAAKFPGVTWNYVEPYENNWEVLPK